MARKGYSMQRVVREYDAPPRFIHSMRPEEREQFAHVRWRYVMLACGHIKRDPWETYGNETAVKMKALFHAIQPRPRKCRCHKCSVAHP